MPKMRKELPSSYRRQKIIKNGLKYILSILYTLGLDEVLNNYETWSSVSRT